MTEKIELAQPDINIEKKSEVVALVALLVAVIAMSFTAIFIKVSVSEISANATVFNRLWLATLVFGMWNGFQKIRRQELSKDSKELPKDSEIRKTYQWQDIVFLLLVAIVHVVGRFLWTWSLTQTGTANATVMSNLTPIFTTLGGWLFLSQSFDRRFLIGLLVALGGAIALGVDDFAVSTHNAIGDVAALLSSVFYAASFLLIEKLRNKFSATNILWWRCLLGTIFMVPLVTLLEDQIFPISGLGWLAVICLATVCEFLGQGLIVYSLKRFSAGFVTTLMLMEPAITAILAWIIFGEKLDFFNWVGLAVVLEGIYLAKTGKGAEKQESLAEEELKLE